VVDGAPDDRLLSELGAVMPYFDRTIDGIMVTNPDSDHYRGFIDMLSRYKVGEEFEPGTVSDTPTYALLEKTLKEKSVPQIIARKGMKIILDQKEGVYIEILFPDRDVRGWTTNDGSIVAKLVYGSTSAMLQGDSTKKIEKYLLATDKADLPAQILKLGHHGSKTSTSPEYVAAVNPEYAIASIGINNRYGFPHPETIATLKDARVPFLHTDVDGRITFVSNGKSWERK
jgi:competence protein ComEC